MAMNDNHKKILQVNRTNFLKNISDVRAVVSGLISKGVITEFMEEEILANKTKTGKIQELMSLLPRRGNKAFDLFYEILVENEEFVVADCIKPELKESRLAKKAEQTHITHMSPSIPPIPISHIEELPSVFPDPADIIKSVVKTCETEEMKSKLKKKSSVYPFTTDKRGLCLLVNNEYFEDTRKFEDRNSDPDAIALTSLFDNLNFETILGRDLTAEDMIKVVDAACEENGDFDCFVFVVLSYGRNGCVYGVDGIIVDTDDIVKSVDRCPKFRNKPKLFFIQACQTVIDTAGSGDDMLDGGQPLEISIRSEIQRVLPSSTQADSNMEPKLSNIPMKSDLNIAISVASDVFMSDEIVVGTLFPLALVYVFTNYAHQCDLHSLMTKVNALMKLKNPDASVISENSLKKEFYFFPGLTNAPLNQIQPS